MNADAPVTENSAAAESPGGPRLSIALVRARLVDGDIDTARAAFDRLTVLQEANAELALTEAMLLEAEGREQEALARLNGIVVSKATAAWLVALSHVRLARLATRLGLGDVAEASGMAMLALNPDDVEGLRALAFAQRRNGGGEAHLHTLRRLAGSPEAEEADVWGAIDAFAGAEQWAVVQELIERREFELDPWRMTPVRVTALIRLGWNRRAGEQLVKAHADGYIRGRQAVELLIACGALALTAGFIVGSMSDDLWQSQARTTLTAIATRLVAVPIEGEAPLLYADAIQALDILRPGQADTESGVKRAREQLTRNAAKLLASDDPEGATQSLVAAVRLAPNDRSLLEALADAANRAGLTERYLDTLLRIWTTNRDTSALLATARGVLETSSWATISKVMGIAASEAGSLGLGIDVVVEEFRQQACRKVDDYIRSGEVAAALELLIGLARQWSIVEWPESLVSRLLRATKRKVRGQRAGGEALIAAVGSLYLELAPGDVEICRMMARVRVRQRRLAEARDLLGRVVENNPHVAGDWLALAIVQHELGEFEAREFSVARALVIAPDNELPPVLTTVREQMGLA